MFMLVIHSTVPPKWVRPSKKYHFKLRTEFLLAKIVKQRAIDWFLITILTKEQERSLE